MSLNAHKLGGARRKNGHKSMCSCHICENMTAKAKRGGYQEELEKEKEKLNGGSKKKNGHKKDCTCPICKNMANSKKGGRLEEGSRPGGQSFEGGEDPPDIENQIDKEPGDEEEGGIAATTAPIAKASSTDYDDLDAAEKGFSRLSEAVEKLAVLKTSTTSSISIPDIIQSFYKAMSDDFNAPILLAKIFDAVKYINSVNDGKATITKQDLELLSVEINSFVTDVLGLTLEKLNSDAKLSPVMDLVLDIRKSARENKDWTTSDKIRDGLAIAGIEVKDGKEGTTWN